MLLWLGFNGQKVLKLRPYVELGDVAEADHLWRVVQEAADASQPL